MGIEGEMLDKVTRFAWTAVLLLPHSPSRADEPPLLKRTREAFESNVRSLAGLEVDGVRSREMLAPAPEALKSMGTLESEAEFTQPVRFGFRSRGDRIYESFRYPTNKYQSQDEIHEYSFDGSKYFAGSLDTTGSDKRASLMITEPALLQREDRSRAVRVQVFQLWYAIEVGCIGPFYSSELGQPIEPVTSSRHAGIRVESMRDAGREGEDLVEIVVTYPEPWASPGTARVEDDAMIGIYKGESKQLQMRLERERRTLRGQSRHCRLLLDGKIGYAVREKWESRSASGPLLHHTKNYDFERVGPDGAWFPRRCRTLSHAYDTAPLYVSPEPLYATEIRVERIIRANPSDEQFRLWYGRPGAKVNDYTHPHALPGRPYSYLVPALLGDVEAREPVAKSRPLAAYATAGLAVLAALGALFARIRSRAGHRTSRPASARPT